jgi:hypothetical protein
MTMPMPTDDVPGKASDLEGVDAAFERRLLEWLREDVGVADARRIARVDDAEVLISKTDARLAPALHALMDRLPELIDEASVLDAYEREGAAADPRATRLECWDRAMRSLVRRVCEARGIEEDGQALVRVGLDSVRAVMESVLWTVPTVDDKGYSAHRAERAAYRDAMRKMAGHDLFTRHYGVFEARGVVNHCPGSQYARVIAAQAWRVCTGESPPQVDDQMPGAVSRVQAPRG